MNSSDAFSPLPMGGGSRLLQGKAICKRFGKAVEKFEILC